MHLQRAMLVATGHVAGDPKTCLLRVLLRDVDTGTVVRKLVHEGMAVHEILRNAPSLEDTYVSLMEAP